MLIKQIEADKKVAFKERDKFKNMILTTLLSEAQMVGKNNGNRETNDEEVIACAIKFKKNVNETIKHLSKTDVAYELCQDEIKIYENYLPSLMTEEELADVIKIYIQTFVGICNVGSIMSFLSQTYKGQYDGKMASGLARGLL